MKISTLYNHKWIKKSLILLFWISVWQMVYKLNGRSLIIPSPIQTFMRLLDFIQNPIFYTHVLASLNRVIIGVAISFFSGLAFGIVCFFIPFLRSIFRPLIITIQATPVMSFIIIALLWFQSIYVPIFTCVLIGFPIVYSNTLTGLSTVDQNLCVMAKVYKVKKRYVIKDIYLPHVSSYLLSSLSLCLGLGWKVTVAAEILSTPKYAIGYQLLDAKIYLDSEGVFAWTIVVIILSFIFDVLLRKRMAQVLIRKKWIGEKGYD